MTRTANMPTLGRARAGAPPAANDSPPGLIITTAEQLQAIVAGAVAEALAQQAPVATRRLLDRHELARAFSCSASMVDELRRRGMPFLRVGESPRYDIDECIAWLSLRKKDNEK
jgi:hypothetical protein